MLPSCGSLTASGRTEVHYVRATKLPEETTGLLRVCEEKPIQVNIVGTDVVAPKDVDGYILFQEEDAAQLIRNTEDKVKLQLQVKALQDDVKRLQLVPSK